MKKLVNSFRSIWNNYRIRFKIYFSYPFKQHYERVKSFVPSNIELKQGIVIEKNVELSSNIKEIGKYVYIANNTYIGFCSKIGSFTSISFGVKIGLREHPLEFVSTSPVFYAKRRGWVDKDGYNEIAKGMTEIGNDVLISANAVILCGVKIGDGAVIAAGAVVNKDVEPYSIVGGVPAKHIKFRFDEEVRLKLLKSKWWELEDHELKKMVLDFNNPTNFLNHFDTNRAKV